MKAEQRNDELNIHWRRMETISFDDAQLVADKSIVKCTAWLAWRCEKYALINKPNHRTSKSIRCCFMRSFFLFFFSSHFIQENARCRKRFIQKPLSIIFQVLWKCLWYLIYGNIHNVISKFMILVSAELCCESCFVAWKSFFFDSFFVCWSVYVAVEPLLRVFLSFVLALCCARLMRKSKTAKMFSEQC